MADTPPPAKRRLSDGPLGVLWRVLRSNPLSLFGFLLVAVILLAALMMLADPHLLAPYGAQQYSGATHAAPSLQHPFGTDGTGYDVYSNVMLALPLDLGIGIAIAGSALLIGGGLGLIAGFFDRPRTLGGAVSVVILRITDIFLSFPSLILALAITRVLGIGVGPTLIAIAVTWWPYYVRLVRGEVLAVKHLPFVVAARAAGVSEWRILGRHVVRNVTEPLIVYFTLDIGTVLVTYSTIGFIGVASRYPGPAPEWGAMLAFYQSSGAINVYPWELIGPGLAIFVTVFAFSLLGDGLRDILDPRTRRAFVRGSTTHEPPAETASAALPSTGPSRDTDAAIAAVPGGGGG
ncbi:MAG TPA: ABC transporter permease [Thermoplasmata archaeon]|nr:ABC transporter permease [Thermoplasmata archaeon]